MVIGREQRPSQGNFGSNNAPEHTSRILVRKEYTLSCASPLERSRHDVFIHAIQAHSSFGLTLCDHRSINFGYDSVLV